MTPTDELCGRVWPMLAATIRETDLPWWKRSFATMIGPYLLKLVVQVLLAMYGATISRFVTDFFLSFQNYLNEEGKKELDFANRLLRQSPSTFDPAVVKAISVKGAYPIFQRDTAA
ncbi:MAG: hypothetical protein AB7G11_02550 [Phycisphaerales bacterium]